MLIERNPVNGSYEVSDYVAALGRLVVMTYYDYTRREAISLFRQHVRDLKAEVIKEKHT